MINGFATTEELANKAAAMGKHSGGCIFNVSFQKTYPGSTFISANKHSVFFHIDNMLLFHTVSKGLVPKPLHVPFRTEEDLLARAIAQGPKTVDVPASLPTPPHNNQEELR